MPGEAMQDERYIIGVDTGGTFTDVVGIASDGTVHVEKARTTPGDFSIGVMDALTELARAIGIDRNQLLRRCRSFKHGTTVATNAVINRVGSRVGLITTKGFEDTTLIMRAIGRVAGLTEDEIKHQAACTKPEPIVPKALIRGVTERINYRGEVIIPINRREAASAIRSLVEERQVEAIAVNFLFSFMNPVHEQAIKDLMEEMYPGGDVACFCSKDVCPVVREYARANTVILNAMLSRTVTTYISGLAAKLARGGYGRRLLIMQANGGIAPEGVAPIALLSSGPVGGVLASKYMADTLGHDNVITTDMGGTSFDVGLLVDGFWRYEREPIIGRFHITWPMVQVESIGAGGGTTARVDHLGRLLVGPSSAGAEPGPVCYDRGGAEPTVTDADLILGYINPDYFLGGRIPLNRERAISVLEDRIARPLGMDAVEAAAGIYDVANANMADLIRKQVLRVGNRPDEFVIYCFGGAGGVHAVPCARDMGVQRIYCFPTSAVFCAFGVAAADMVYTRTFSYRYRMPVAAEVLNGRLAEIEGELLEHMEKDGIAGSDVRIRRTFYMRYRRQLNELEVSVPTKTYGDGEIEEIIDLFHRRYESVYGQDAAYRESGVELISINVDAIAAMTKPTLARYPEGGASPAAALKGERDAYFTGDIAGFRRAAVFDHAKLAPGNRLEGPAIIETPITTIVIPPGDGAEMDCYRNIVITIGG